MPMFEYECKNCDYHFDKIVQRWDTDTRCPLCDGPADKQLSRFSVGASHNLPGAMPANMQPKLCSNC